MRCVCAKRGSGRSRMLIVASAAATMLVGCAQAPQAPPKPPPPEVIYSTPVFKEVTEYEDLTGRTEAVAAVEVRARATGYLREIHFEEGSLVKKGDLLFEIDDRIYQAEVKHSEAALKQAQATVKRLELDLTRANTLLPQRAISQQDFDKILGDMEEAKAAVEVALADRDRTKLKLSFTKVTAPSSGKISRRFVDPGNLIKEDDTVLTSIVSQNPLYVNFFIDERTALRFRRMIEAGKIKSIRESDTPFLMGLADEEGYSHKGKINFVDNRVDPGTGTLRLRGVIDNKNSVFSPGMFVRLRVLIGEPRKALLVPEKAIGTDQGKKFLFVINDKDEAEYRPVEIGLLVGDMRVIEKGLREGERFVLNGLQRVRPNAKVTPKREGEQSKGPGKK